MLALRHVRSAIILIIIVVALSLGTLLLSRYDSRLHVVAIAATHSEIQ